MKCIKCGVEISDSAKFCPECGTKQLEGKICPECKKLNDVKAKFCIACGNKLVKETVSDAPKKTEVSSAKKSVSTKVVVEEEKIYRTKNFHIASIIVEDDVVVYGPEFF